MRRRKKDGTWKPVIIIAIIFICIGSLAYFAHFNAKITEKLKNNQTTEKTDKDKKDTEDVTNTDTKTDNQNTDDSTNTKDTKEETEEFTNQTGEKVEVTGEKIVSATGFAGASNHKFYLKDGNLYYKNISTDDNEELIATSVKDLYLENKEVTAELNSDGKIVKENNYVTYK